ncbi:hypothetical protein EJ357_29365 [Streptomyces cyaneochromogenes]|uniref:Uncharacterized protein n=1 Tax=Streptomyces cyaneochromogenes TaxID=2496836 RepID=A0A3S9MD13_9ACTN|nr:hypothetical protein [Streptomyces cyaneochromogenes]AZQ37048.1 hypothetical protein EJ357_29365 [Streptomyces cyaneochromogenes]
MSWANNGPAGPAQGQPYGPSQPPGPPRSVESAPTEKAKADQVRYGPVEVSADGTDSGSYLELDTPKPVVMSSTNGADIIFSGSLAPNLFVPDSVSDLAPWHDPEAVPTAVDGLESDGKTQGHGLGDA